MKNIFKLIGYLIPTALFVTIAVYFCLTDPLVLLVTRVVIVAFYAIIVAIIMLCFTAVVFWGLKNTIFQLFKMSIDFKSKKN